MTGRQIRGFRQLQGRGLADGPAWYGCDRGRSEHGESIARIYNRRAEQRKLAWNIC